MASYRAKNLLVKAMALGRYYIQAICVPTLAGNSHTEHMRLCLPCLALLAHAGVG